MKNLLRLSISLLISAFCLYLALKGFEWSDLKDALANLSWSWVLLGVVVYCNGFVLRTFKWRVLLSPFTQISPGRLFPILMFGYLLNNVLPARAGEFARAYTVSKETQSPMSTCLGTVIMDRMTDFIGLGVVLLVGAQVIPNPSRVFTKGGAALLVGFLGVGLMLALSRKLKNSKQVMDSPLIGKIKDLIYKFIEGFRSLQSPMKMGTVALLSVCIWMHEALTIKILSHAFGINLSFIQSCALVIGISLGAMIPAAPGYVGTYEFFGKKSMMYLGFSEKVALPFILTLHFFQLFWTCLMGLPYLLKFGLIRAPEMNPKPVESN